MLLKIAFGNVRKSFRDFSVFFLTLAFGVCVFYAFGSITTQAAAIDLMEDQRDTVQVLADTLQSVSVFEVVIMGFLVVYANRFLIRRRKREFGIYLTLGMDLSRVSLIIIAETLLVGVAALAMGLVLGVCLSQLMMYVTARLFEATIKGFTFVFSPEAALGTVGCFAGIFLISLVFNVGTVARYKLIDLINADRVSEKVRLRSLPLSVVLFIASVVILGVAYKVLLDHGMMEEGPYFGIATALCAVGTLLFFFSLSGFLLRLVQSSKRLYYSGLNMFTLRQLNSRINTAWLSISLVCAMLFIAICGVCTGFSVSTNLNSAVIKGTAYDASLYTYPDGMKYNLYAKPDGGTYDVTPAAQDGYDMAVACARDVAGWDELVAATAQVDTWELADDDPLTLEWFVERTDYSGSALLDQALESSSVTHVSVAKISQFNALRELRGEKPLELGPNECVFWNDMSSLTDFFRAAAEQNPEVQVGERTLTFASEKVVEDVFMNSVSGSVAGVLVVPDDAVPADAVRYISVLDVTYAGERSEVEPRFQEAVHDAYGERMYSGYPASSWPVYSCLTAEENLEQSGGTTAIVMYLAIYIGLIFLVSCASVLALQQLSEAADNVSRYRVLSQLGAEQRLINRALFTQIGIYFLFPLVVAVAHASVALRVVNDIVELLTGFQIGTALVGTVAFVVVLYGGYFLVTYQTSKGIILRQ